MKHLTIRVEGRVQGVFYRAFAQSAAVQWNIHGLVRNEPDGSVYIEAEGEDKNLREFIALLRKGPERAVVTSVTAEEKDALRYYTHFRIDR